MKIKNSLLILVVILVLLFVGSFVNAVPQVIFSELNISITNGSYSIIGEGLNAQDSFSVNGNCSFNYSRIRIPITFSRDFESNNTDVAVLINALAKNYNISNKWEQCVLEVAHLNSSYTQCAGKAAFESNYTTCMIDFTNCDATRAAYSEQMTAKNAEVSTLRQQQLFLIIGLAVAVFFAFNFYNKNRIKLVDSPLSQLPSRARM